MNVDRGYSTVRRIGETPLFRGKEPLLTHLDIELTERCNNDCLHCNINLPAADEQARAAELSTEQWKEVLRQAANLGALSVRFTGGEPLVREDFAELYLFARRLGMKVLLFTNARLITPELADLFARVPPLEKIEVTVYGMHPGSYDANARDSEAFGEAWRGIGLLLEREIPFVVKSVVLPANAAEIDEFETWAATLPSMDSHPGYSVFLDLRGRRDSEAANRRIARLRMSPEEGVQLLARHDDRYRREIAEFAGKFMGTPSDLLFGCGAGVSGCIDAYGHYQMCLLLRHPDTVYDLLVRTNESGPGAVAPSDGPGAAAPTGVPGAETGIPEGALRTALTEVFPRLRELRATNPEYLRRCARCFLKGLCEQCPAKSWSEHGTLDTPVEYLCEVAHAQARYLGLLAEGERAWELEDWRPRIEALQAAVAAGAGVRSAAETSVPPNCEAEAPYEGGTPGDC